MKKCLFINNSPQPGRRELAKLGGGGKSLLALLSDLPGEGVEAHVVVPAEGQFTDALVEMGIPHTLFPPQPLQIRRPIQALAITRGWRAILQRERPDLIHANGFELSRSFALAAGSLGIPYITHVRFPVEAEGARWVLRGLPKPAAFIFNSQAMLDSLWPFLRKLTPASRPYVLHNAVDLSQFTAAPWPETEQLRIGIVANFAPFKRHEDFLRMAAEMLGVREDLEFLVIGDDTEGSGRGRVLKDLARDLGISDSVQFLGHRSDIPDLMRSMHLLVVPSRFEPFGRVVIEAMACARPVVGSRDGGIPEIIDHGRTGFLAEVGDYRAFARHALEVLEDRGRWEAIGRAAMEDVWARFSSRAHTRHTLEIYRDLLDSR